MTGPAYWHKISCACDKGHELAIMAAEASRFGNIRLSWVCVQCGGTHQTEHSLVALMNECHDRDDYNLVVNGEPDIIDQEAA